MIAAILLAACISPPLFDLTGPDCSPANQEIECQCSECATWLKADGSEWYDFQRTDQDGTVHTVIGSTRIHHSYTDDDGVFHEQYTDDFYCFAMDASTPLEGRRYVYRVRACSTKWTPTCSGWSDTSVAYIGAPVTCYDQSQGGKIDCPFIP